MTTTSRTDILSIFQLCCLQYIDILCTWFNDGCRVSGSTDPEASGHSMELFIPICLDFPSVQYLPKPLRGTPLTNSLVIIELLIHGHA